VPEAERLFLQSLQMHQRLFKGDRSGTATALYNLAMARQEIGRTADAEPLFAQALEMSRRLFKGDNVHVADRVNGVANARFALNRASEAEPLSLEALQMRQRLFKSGHPDVAASLSNLATIRMALGRTKEAKELAEQSVAMSEKLMPAEDGRLKNYRTILAAASMAAVPHPSPAFWFNYIGEPHLWTHPDATHWQEAYPDGKSTSFLVQDELKGDIAGTIVRRIPDEVFEVLIPPLMEDQPLRFRQNPTEEWRSLGPIHVIE
jgi:tetratricopeptide (TPR) repeat protein